MDIAFCVDRGALAGLHITLTTLLRHLSSSTCRIHLLYDGLTPEDLDLLRRTTRLAGYAGAVSVEAQAVDIKLFRSLRSHIGHGWMAYARIVAPSLIDTPRLLYLDADLLVYADLAELDRIDLDGNAVGAATWGTAAESNDAAFLCGQGIAASTPYFNSGVLVFDRERWIRQSWITDCLAFGAIHGTNLPSADQTILNAIVRGRFAQIPRRFNTPVTASRPLLSRSSVCCRVVHLVSRPKPWDALGFLNGQYAHYRDALSMTAIPGHFAHPVLRDVRKLRFYAKCWRNLQPGLRRTSPSHP